MKLALQFFQLTEVYSPRYGVPQRKIGAGATLPNQRGGPAPPFEAVEILRIWSEMAPRLLTSQAMEYVKNQTPLIK